MKAVLLPCSPNKDIQTLQRLLITPSTGRQGSEGRSKCWNTLHERRFAWQEVAYLQAMLHEGVNVAGRELLKLAL